MLLQHSIRLQEKTRTNLAQTHTDAHRRDARMDACMHAGSWSPTARIRRAWGNSSASRSGWCVATSVWQCNIAALQHCSVATLQRCNIAALQHCSVAALQHCSVATLQRCNMRCCARVSRRRTSRTTPTSVRPFDADVGCAAPAMTGRQLPCGAVQARTRRT